MDTKPEKKENERKDYRKRNSLYFSVIDFVKTQHDTDEVGNRAAQLTQAPEHSLAVRRSLCVSS